MLPIINLNSRSERGVGLLRSAGILRRVAVVFVLADCYACSRVVSAGRWRSTEPESIGVSGLPNRLATRTSSTARTSAARRRQEQLVDGGSLRPRRGRQRPRVRQRGRGDRLVLSGLGRYRPGEDESSIKRTPITTKEVRAGSVL